MLIIFHFKYDKQISKLNVENNQKTMEELNINNHSEIYLVYEKPQWLIYSTRKTYYNIFFYFK